jgi:ceramide glucosyltransferase
MLVFYLFAALVLWQGILSLIDGFRYLAFMRAGSRVSKSDFAPYASVVVPVRGLDQELQANINALCTQDYADYEIIFVTDSLDDPAIDYVNEARRSLDERFRSRVRTVIAGQARESGQKVHNLRVAVQKINPTSEILVFADSDAQPHKDWLRSLVTPLQDEQVGATTGYRWFVPVRGNFCSYLRAVWNASIASSLGARESGNFCWGGSTAIRRQTFEEIEMREYWRGTLSDDFALTRRLQSARLPIRFVPRCLTATREDCDWREMIEFTTRQIKITRVYAPHLWLIVLISNLLFTSVFFGGLILVAMRIINGASYIVPLVILLVIFALGASKAFLRLRAVSVALTEHRQRLWSTASVAAHLLLWPVASVIYLYNALAALASRRIRWRGIEYYLKSATETAIIARDEE